MSDLGGIISTSSYLANFLLPTVDKHYIIQIANAFINFSSLVLQKQLTHPIIIFVTYCIRSAYPLLDQCDKAKVLQSIDALENVDLLSPPSNKWLDSESSDDALFVF